MKMCPAEESGAHHSAHSVAMAAVCGTARAGGKSWSVLG